MEGKVRCHRCKQDIEPGRAHLEKVNGKWRTFHHQCKTSLLTNALLALPLVMFLLFSYLESYQPSAKLVTTALQTPAYKPTSIFSEQEVECMSRTVYGESRGESAKGQVMVAMSIASRALDGRWPSDVCKVVSQPGQFKAYNVKVRDKEAYSTAKELSQLVAYNFFNAPKALQEVRHFHSGSGSPFHWNSKFVLRVGNHSFYTD